MKLKQKVILWYIELRKKLKQNMLNRYIEVRKKFLKRWTKISEKNRKKFFISLSSAINFFLTALLLTVPITLLTTVSPWKTVISLWFFLPFMEHYYIWFRETWKYTPVK